MAKLNIFDDGRKLPKLSVNIKVKIKSRNQEELSNWNTFFGYLMKKQRTKLEFLSVGPIRDLGVSKVKVEDIKDYLQEYDYNELMKIENVFNKKITTDVKAFVLAMLKVPFDAIKNIVA